MIPLMVFDSNLTYVAQIDDYEYFRWERKLRKVNYFEIRINRYKNYTDQLAIGNYVVFNRNGENRIGRIEFKEIGLTGGKESEQWTISGRSVSGIYEERICLHNVSAGTGYDTITSNAETVMRNYVTNNLINPTDTNRRVTLYELAPNQNRGISVSASARFQTIAEVLENVSLASGLGYRTTFNMDTKKFIFDVIQGVDRTVTNGVNPIVIFSPDYDNIMSMKFRNSVEGIKNVAIVGGQGEGIARTIEVVGTQTGIDRKEVFVDARDLATGLSQRGNERLTEYGEEVIMEFEHTQIGPFIYLEDFDLGDIVTVIYPDIVTMDVRIVEVIEEVTNDMGLRYSITVGSDFPDLISVIKRDMKNIAPEIRR